MSRAVKEERMKEGGEARWIQKAVPPENKGKLHRRLGVPEGKKIPAGKLEKALHSNDSTLKREAQFAENVRNLKRKK